MPATTYTFGDIYTGQIIADIPLYGVTMSDAFDGGEFRGTFQFDMTGKDNEVLAAATIPGRCFVVAERDGVPIWSGYLQNRTYQSQSKSAQLYGRGWEAYSERRFVRQDFTFTQQDQITIFRTLFSNMITDPKSIIFELFPSFTSGVLRDLSVMFSEYKTYAQVFSQLADGDDGFDWKISTARTGGVYRRILAAGYPTLGGKDPQNLTFEYPGNILNYWENETMSEAGTHIFTLGAGEGNDMLVSFNPHLDLIGGNFPRYDVAVSKKDITDSGILASIGAQEAAKAKAPKPIFTIQVKGFPEGAVGDAVHISITDPKHPTGYYRDTRMLRWEYTPESADNTEETSIIFEGDEEVE